jgi:hypothetical protein
MCENLSDFLLGCFIGGFVTVLTIIFKLILSSKDYNK